MPLLIDAYNLLHVTGVLPPELAGPDLAGLVVLIEQSRYRHLSTVLFCDGSPPGGLEVGSEQIRIRFSGPGRTADDLMIAAIRRSNAPRRVIAVTGDREIQREARRRRCRVISSEEFMGHLAADAAERGGGRPARRVDPLSPEETREWLDTFDLSKDDLSLIASEPEPIPAEASEPPAEPVPASPASQPVTDLPEDVIREADELAATDDPPPAEPVEEPELPPPAEQSSTPDIEHRFHSPAADEPLFPQEILDDADRLASDDQQS